MGNSYLIVIEFYWHYVSHSGDAYLAEVWGATPWTPRLFATEYMFTAVDAPSLLFLVPCSVHTSNICARVWIMRRWSRHLIPQKDKLPSQSRLHLLAKLLLFTSRRKCIRPGAIWTSTPTVCRPSRKSARGHIKLPYRDPKVWTHYIT